MKIELRTWTMNEAEIEALKRLCNNQNLRTYIRNSLPYPYTVADAKWFIHHTIEDDGIKGIYRAIVVDGIYAGNITIDQKDDVYCKSAEIGYMIGDAYWSKGIVTEAVRRMCDLAYEQLDIVRIEATVYAPNIGSHRVLEKNGFALEGIKRKAVYKNYVYYDSYIYGLIRCAN